MLVTMALVDKTSAGTRSVTSVEGLSSFLVDVDTGEGDNWALDPLVSASPEALDPLVPANPEALDLATILHALSDPVRLRIVAQLSDGGERTCGSLDLPVAKSTCSHHFRVLREAGVVSQRVDGKCRFNRLRAEQLEQRFPGLLAAVLRASAPSDPSRA
jgi:DNA-binding transcriptional ArsR family regulator